MQDKFLLLVAAVVVGNNTAVVVHTVVRFGRKPKQNGNYNSIRM